MPGCPPHQRTVAENYYWARLTPFEKASFELHYLGCPGCQRVLDDVNRTFSGVEVGVEVGVDPPAPRPVRLRLYVNQVSEELAGQIKDLVAAFGPEQVLIETLHVQEHPAAAEADRVMCTPTLVRLAPLPKLVMVGIPKDSSLLRNRLGAVA